YFELRLQLATGALRREYAVLCHGFIPGRTEINAPVVWSSSSVSRDELTKVTPRGWPAKTQLLPCASAEAEGSAMTLLDVRIQTGRRHQIRTHLAHIGAASVADGKYSADSTYQNDLRWCPRNFLHRYRLCFNLPCQIKNASPLSLSEPLPLDLRQALAEVRVLKLFGQARDWIQLLNVSHVW
ncbi:unnamed protein product, partial [Symbiodinium sp. CCMP2456]